MKNRALILSCSLASFVFLMSCNSTHNGSQSNVVQNGNVQIIGAGSTFVYPIMSRWIVNYQQSHPGVRINYQSIGSGGGIQQLKKGLVDFGASDAALDDSQLKDMPALVQIAESAGPVCITYNLPNLNQPLKLSAASLSGIFLGTIKNWQDPAIKKDNPGVNFPMQDIVVAHRSDGSGTTNIFTTYLSAVNPQWANSARSGLSVNWPVGIGGKGSEGVTGLIKQNPGSIGYVELTYAMENHLPTAQVQNSAGKYIAPSSASASAAIEAFSQELNSDVRKPIVNPSASAADAYPISGLTFLLIPRDPKDPAKGAQVKQFINYVLTDGQNLADQMNYAKLPTSLQHIDEQLLAQVLAGTGGGSQ
jgi:phosphate transport system substrate-binding protein